MKIAITGANGYLGKQIIKKLLKDKRINYIVAIDKVKIPINNKKLKPVICDITNPEIAKIISGCEVLVHLAFIIGDSTNRPALYRVNVDGSRNVFESAAKVGVKKIIVASSIAVYGYYPDNPEIIYETHPLRGNPDNAYSDTKVLVELLLDDFEKRYPEISIIRFRPGVILGPNTRNNFRIMLEVPFWIDFENCPGFFSKTPVVHEEDVASAFILGIFSKKTGAYNLVAEPFVTREQILKRTKQIPIKLPVNLIGKIMDITFKLKLSNSPASDLYYAIYPIPASGKKAIKELGWKPKYSGLEALEELLSVIKRERKNIPLTIFRILTNLQRR
jgi:UDP-glucose 4-epimerase